MRRKLHLLPIPEAKIIPFPNTLEENREAVIAQMENHQAALIARNGSYLGRQMFLEAAVAVAVRAARQVHAEDTREALLHAFDYENGIGITGFASL